MGIVSLTPLDIQVQDRQKIPTTMKFLLIVALLPCALAQCPEHPPPECHGADILCGGMPMCDGVPCDGGCPSAQWCMTVNPFERCSSRAACPTECLPTELMCPGSTDQDGCPSQGTCMPSMNGDCPAHCPVQCSEMEIPCPGEVDANGCSQPDFCMPYDPWYPYPTFCPVFCKENEIFCPGGPGLPDSCIPFDPEAPCAPVCPPACNPENQIYCPGWVDPETGCEWEGYCQHYEPTAICQHSCPMQCPFGEYPCWMGFDDLGCPLPEICSDGGICYGPDGEQMPW